jgi:hypothetical protein
MGLLCMNIVATEECVGGDNVTTDQYWKFASIFNRF